MDFSNSQGACLDLPAELSSEHSGGIAAHFSAVNPFAQMRVS